jgi:cysteine desulfurase
MIHPGLADGPIYLDYNATTPVDPRVVDAALPYLTHHFGNPSSSHAYAARPRAAIAEARGRSPNCSAPPRLRSPSPGSYKSMSHT